MRHEEDAGRRGAVPRRLQRGDGYDSTLLVPVTSAPPLVPHASTLVTSVVHVHRHDEADAQPAAALGERDPVPLSVVAADRHADEHA